MYHDISLLERVCYYFLTGVMGILSVMCLLCLILIIRGPKAPDRLLAVNMLGETVIAFIAVLSVYLDEGYLLDIGLIYALISFLAVVVLSQIYTAACRRQDAGGREKKEEGAAV